MAAATIAPWLWFELGGGRVAYVVTASFSVRTPADTVFRRYIGDVSAHMIDDLITSVLLVDGGTSGAVTVRTVVTADNAATAGRVARRALKSAVTAVGPPEAWRAWWTALGPTWITEAPAAEPRVSRAETVRGSA